MVISDVSSSISRILLKYLGGDQLGQPPTLLHISRLVEMTFAGIYFLWNYSISPIVYFR